MSFTIGRVGTTPALRDPSSWQPHGDTVVATGYVAGLSVADAKVVRAQLIGLANNPDEPVVPVTWSGDSTADGFYRIDDVQVGSDPSSLNNGYFPWTVTMTRVQSYAMPFIESRLLGALRVNASSITAGTELPWIAIPSAYTSLLLSASGSTVAWASDETRSATTIDRTTVTHDSLLQYSISAANYYSGACLIETGSTLYPVMGRQTTAVTTEWRLSNSELRVTGTLPGGASCMRLNLSVNDGSTPWRTAKSFTFRDRTGAAELVSGTPRSITILRNTVECGAIRVKLDAWTIDLLLRRGARAVYARLHQDDVGTYKLAIRPSSTAAATSLTGGLEATAADADSNKFVLGSPSTFSKDLSTGEIYLTSAGTTFDFMAGLNPGTGIHPSSGQELIYQYMSADTEALRIVTR